MSGVSRQGQVSRRPVWQAGMTPVPEGMKESEHTTHRDRLLLYYLLRTFVGSNSSYAPESNDTIDHSFSTYLLST